MHSEGHWVYLCIFLGRGQINAESEPVQQRECSDKGYPLVASSAGINRNVSKFFRLGSIQHDEGWNKLEDPGAGTTRQKRLRRRQQRLFLR
jgi:hypothetical protein